MTNLIKCDMTGETVNFEGSYQMTIYNRKSKTRMQLDICHKAFMESILTKVDPELVKWKKWDGAAKQYKDVE